MSDQPNDPTAQNRVSPQQPQDSPAKSAHDVPDYLVWSILATLFCCQPLGIAAIVYSAGANSKKFDPDPSAALSQAATAKKLLWWSLGLGIAAVVIFVGFYIAVLLGSFAFSESLPDSTTYYDTY